MLVAQTTATDLNSRLRRIQWGGALIDPNSAEYLALDRELSKLVKTDATASYSLRGQLCGLAGDAGGLRSNFAKAFKLSSAPAIQANYAVCLNNLGFFSEAAAHLPLLERPEIGELSQAITLTIECARFRRAVRLIELWNTLHATERMEFGELNKAASVVEQAGLNEDAFLPCLDVVGEVLRNNRLIFYDEPIASVVQNETSEEISFRFLVIASAKTAAALEAEMVDKLFSSDIDVHDSVIHFGFLSTAVEAAQQAA